MYVNGKPLPPLFQRSCGYVQQQDVCFTSKNTILTTGPHGRKHCARSFAILGIAPPTPVNQSQGIFLSYIGPDIKEKYDYVETVIDLLEMREYADAVIGVPGEGLNVLQRKKLTVSPLSHVSHTSDWCRNGG